jgi:DNA-dependent RNA polymerase auxiliary subunit epsilon
MTELELFITEQISQIVPSYEKLEVRALVADTSYSIEFWATIDGKKMQCYDMVDEGLIDEEEMDSIMKEITNFIRSSSDYVKGTVNKISVVI